MCNKEKLEVQAEIREEMHCLVWACEWVSQHSPRALWVSPEMQVCPALMLSPSPSTSVGDALVLFPALPSCSTNERCSSQWGRIRVQWQWPGRCQSTGDTWKHSELKEKGKVIRYHSKSETPFICSCIKKERISHYFIMARLITSEGNYTDFPSWFLSSEVWKTGLLLESPTSSP